MRKPEKQKKQRERIYAALLCICTMLSLVSVPVLAAEMRKGAGSNTYSQTRRCDVQKASGGSKRIDSSRRYCTGGRGGNGIYQ